MLLVGGNALVACYFKSYCALYCVNPVVGTSHPHKGKRVSEEATH